MLNNSYWRGNGKYQKEKGKLESLVPDIGKTQNKYLNLFITMLELYYGYHKKGGNLRDVTMEDINKYIRPFSKELNVRGAINFDVQDTTLLSYLRNESKLEKAMDRVIEFIIDKDLKSPKYYVYYDNANSIIYRTPKQGVNIVAFGTEYDLKNWVKNRIEGRGFKLVG